MTVKEILNRAQKYQVIRKVIIWNPNTSRALYCGFPQEIPQQLSDKETTSYRYDKNKQRMILRI